MMSIQQKRLKQLVLFTLFIVVVAIMLGAFTRLKHAGLGCPDWPGCYGHLLWPDEAHEIEKANAAWPEAQVETDKTWPEMVHRYFASSIGLLSIITLFFSLKWRKHLTISAKLPALILAVVILQGLFGMWTVTLKLWPQVVTGHLLGGFTTLSLVWLLYLFINYKQPAHTLLRAQKDKLKMCMPWLILALIVLVFQIALGGWTTSNYAAVACPDFPTCHQSWWPAMDFAQGFNITQHIGPNYLGGLMENEARTAIHMMHRVGALVTALLLIVVGIKVLFSGASIMTSSVMALWGVLLLQVALGISNVVFDFPISVAVAHNIIGALLLIKLIRVIFYTHQYTKEH